MEPPSTLAFVVCHGFVYLIDSGPALADSDPAGAGPEPPPPLCFELEPDDETTIATTTPTTTSARKPATTRPEIPPALGARSGARGRSTVAGSRGGWTTVGFA